MRRTGRPALAAALVLALAVLAAACSTSNSLGTKSVKGNGQLPALPQISVQPADVTSNFAVGLYPDGDKTVGDGTQTLDLCDGNFPSEALRIARRQTAVVDGSQQLIFSTEAVAYRNAAATAQVFTELRDAQARCPAGFVASQPGGEPLMTVFNPAPDTTWAATPSVDRLAFDYFTANQQGQAARTAAVFLKRGRILLGVYMFVVPDQPPPTIAGQTTVEGIVGVFATRLSQLPASIVAG